MRICLRDHRCSLNACAQPPAALPLVGCQQFCRHKQSGPGWCSWVLPASDFKDDSVGTKCLGVAALAASLPRSIGALPSMALPYAALPRVLEASENAAARSLAQQAPPEAASRVGHPAAAAVMSVRFHQ